MSRARVSAFVASAVAIMFTTIAGSTRGLQEAGTQAGAAPAPRKVRLIIDEQYRGPGRVDRARAQVWTLSAASVPVDEWPTLNIAQPLHVHTLLNRYYDLYASGPGASPLALRAMADAIIEANGALISDTGVIGTGTLKMPPVPIRGRTRYGFEEVQARTFDPQTLAYTAMMKSGDAVMVAAGSDAPPPVSGNADLREGRLTEVVLGMTAEVYRTLRGLTPGTAPLIALDDGGPAPAVATMTLLDAQPAACDSAAAWLPSSPYHPAIKSLFSAADVDKLKQRAAIVPLTIIDWNFATGHGAKVRAVVSQALRDLGLAALDDARFIRTFELNPVRNGDALREALAGYQAFLGANSGDLVKAFDGARDWIRKHKPVDENALEQHVHSLVLQAVFWKHFTHQQALNFSFTTDSAALTVADPKFMPRAAAFGAFAAGNRGLPASILLKPQAEAIHYRTVVNVTHGHLNGVIDGDRTNPAENVIVNLIAPGCGYSVSPITAADNGSSFASPYVATAAWIRMLQGSTVESLKRLLHAASVPLAAVGTSVESGGLFDPALLFLGPDDHLITSAGELVLPTMLAVTLTYETSEGKTISLQNKPAASASISLHACADAATGGAGVCAVVREFDVNGRVILTSGTVTGLTVKAVAADRTIDETAPAAVLKVIRLISY